MKVCPCSLAAGGKAASHSLQQGWTAMRNEAAELFGLSASPARSEGLWRHLRESQSWQSAMVRTQLISIMLIQRPAS